jgi:hypothetical protein
VSYDEDDYWLSCIARGGSNSAVNGWADLVAYIESGTADDRSLWGAQAALRSLSQRCQDQITERREAKRKERYG